MIICSKCGKELREGTRFCTECGSVIPEKKVCAGCGKELGEGAAFCTSCGTRVGAAPSSASVPPVSYASAPSYTAPSTPASIMVGESYMGQPSYFDGRTIALIGINLLTYLLTTISLGFAYPAMYCFKLRWIYSSTVINGYRMKFTGRGGQLFGRYILWTFLTIITFGIFGLWLPVKYKKWEISHVEIDKAV